MDVQNRRVSATRLHSMIGPLAEEGPAYASLARGIRRLVANGRMLHGTVLPSERELVTELGLSRTTVSRAYSELRDRGFATARQGSGTVITVPGGPAPGGQEPMPDGGVELEAAGRHAVDLTCAAPSAPVGMVEHYEAAMAQLPAYISGMGYFPLGLPELRSEIAQVYRRRGLETSPEQIVVTNGALAGFAAVIRAVLPPGSRVLAESPSYPNTIASLRHHGARVSAVPIGPDGTDLEAVGQALRRVQPAAMLCLPDFHNPTGTLLDNEGRERWARQLDATRTVGIVDETAVDLWWDAEPDVEPMAVYSDGIVSIGSASKSHWGGLRLGWVRCPRSLQGAVTTMRTSLDLGAPVLEQLVLTRMLQTGNGLPDESRTRIRAERDWLHATLSDQLPGWKANLPAGGLSLWWNLPAPRSTALAEAAVRHGVLLAPGSVFAVEDHGLEHWIRTPFALPHEELERAVPGIVAAWHEMA